MTELLLSYFVIEIVLKLNGVVMYLLNKYADLFFISVLLHLLDHLLVFQGVSNAGPALCYQSI